MYSTIKNYSHKIFAICLSVTIIFSILLSSTQLCVSAEKISSEAQEVIDLIEKLPTDPETVTLEDKEDIIAAKVAFNALDGDKRIDVPGSKLSILNGDFATLMPFILSGLVKTLKELPDADKIAESEKDAILEMYTEYGFLDDTSKGALSDECKTKLLCAVERFSPEKLSDSDKETVAQLKEKKAQQEAKEAAKKAEEKQKVYKIWKYILMAFAILFALSSLAVIIIMIVKVFIISGEKNEE